MKQKVKPRVLCFKAEGLAPCLSSFWTQYLNTGVPLGPLECHPLLFSSVPSSSYSGLIKQLGMWATSKPLPVCLVPATAARGAPNRSTLAPHRGDGISVLLSYVPGPMSSSQSLWHYSVPSLHTFMVSLLKKPQEQLPVSQNFQLIHVSHGASSNQ